MTVRKLADLLLAGWMMSHAWVLRGQFGHLKGAMIPGAVAALILLLFTTKNSWKNSYGAALLFGPVGFAIGGHFAYGRRIDLILQMDSLGPVMGDFLALFLIGAIWGGIGLSFLGFAFSEKPLMRRDIGFLCGLLLGWFLLHHVLGLGPDIVVFGLGLLALVLYNRFGKHSVTQYILSCAGFFGFGLGFLVAVLLLHAGEHGIFGTSWPWWQLRDQCFGFVGGLFVLIALWTLEGKDVIAVPAYANRWGQGLGLLLLLVYVVAINLANAIGHWGIEGSRIPLDWIRLCWVMLVAYCILIAVIVFVLPARVPTRWVLIGSTLIVLWMLSLAAIAKELAVYGWARWEPAYTQFILSSVVLSFILPWRFGRERPPR